MCSIVKSGQTSIVKMPNLAPICLESSSIVHDDRESHVKGDSAARVIHERERERKKKGLRKLEERSCKHTGTAGAGIDSIY